MPDISLFSGNEIAKFLKTYWKTLSAEAYVQSTAEYYKNIITETL